MGGWRVFENAEAVAEHAADWLCAATRSCEHDFAICLSGGSTPKRFYQCLASEPFVSRFPWNRSHWYWGDERFVPHDHPDSNYRMAFDALFSRVPVSEDRIHPIPTEGLTPEQSAVAYQTLLRSSYEEERLDQNRPLFDVTLLGVGENGHTASLFPGSVALQEQRRWVLPIVGAGREPRITLTYPALNSSRKIAFLVVGANKKDVLAKIRTGDREMPAARIQPVGDLLWFVDQAAMSG